MPYIGEGIILLFMLFALAEHTFFPREKLAHAAFWQKPCHIVKILLHPLRLFIVGAIHGAFFAVLHIQLRAILSRVQRAIGICIFRFSHIIS